MRAWDDLRAFRHFGRHRVYREGVVPELVAAKVRALPEAVRLLRDDLQRFPDGAQVEIRSLEG